MLRQIIKQWFWDSYDHLGRLFVANFILFVFYASIFLGLAGGVGVLAREATPQALALTLFVVIAFVLPVLLLPWIAPLSHFAELISKEKDPGFARYFTGVRKNTIRAWKILQLSCGAFGLLLLNIWFYTSSEAFAAELRTLGFVLAGLCFWLGVLLAAVLLPAIPAYLRSDGSLLAALKSGLYITLKYPGTVFGLLAFIISLWIIAAALRFVGILLFGFAGTYLFLNSLHDVVTAREASQSEEEQQQEQPATPATWKEIKVADKKDERKRMDKSRYERTFKDILRPWEM